MAAYIHCTGDLAAQHGGVRMLYFSSSNLVIPIDPRSTKTKGSQLMQVP